MIEKVKYIYDGKAAEFQIDTDPKFLTVISIINNATDAIVSNTVDYAPYLTTYMIDYSVISSLTDISLPLDLNECHDFIYESEISDSVKDTIPALYDFITENVEKMVEYRKEKILKKSKIDELIDSLINLVEVFTNQFDGVDIKETIDKMEKIGIFNGMNENEVVSSILKYRDKLEESGENNANSATSKADESKVSE